jgi:ABC-type antimicrobial peptide transport system ATPase subunit
LHPVALKRYGYKKARRIGMLAMIGGKDKTKIRNATPLEFRDVLIDLARRARAAL